MTSGTVLGVEVLKKPLLAASAEAMLCVIGMIRCLWGLDSLVDVSLKMSEADSEAA
jgi:hypothetical protein